MTTKQQPTSLWKLILSIASKIISFILSEDKKEKEKEAQKRRMLQKKMVDAQNELEKFYHSVDQENYKNKDKNNIEEVSNNINNRF